MSIIRRLSEGLARKTTRRGLFSRGSDVAFGALIGAAAGGATRAGSVGARHVITHTVCAFPGPPCPCVGCLGNGVCAKPCVINTTWYPNGCWVSSRTDDGVTFNATCCDCTCNQIPGSGVCGCGSDHHNHPDNCPDGNASGPVIYPWV
ncbi:MAG: hypothetical protein WD939_05275 [Dehalococcoidia bacterium]